jgi:3-oxoacyl-[acyl-carrier protein] reductase
LEKIALVTGSTHNMGKATAEVLSQDGFHVIVTSRHEDEAKAQAQKLPNKGSYYVIDYADVAQIKGLFAFIKKTFGRLDVLVNSLAYTRNESILDCTLDIWEQTINTNLRSYFLCTKYAAEIMQTHGGGSIINMTVSSTRGAKDKFSYMVSKGGIKSMTMSAALDLAPFNIRVNAVGSGLVGTPVGHKDFPERARPYQIESIPAGHRGDPSDVAHAISFLVSEKAKYIYGAILPVDGGMNISS